MQTITDELASSGLVPRGIVPADGAAGVETGSIVLIGNAGPEMWNRFAESGMSSLDSWTKDIVDQIALRLSAKAIYPFGGPPYAPFSRWAIATSLVHQSPIGLLIDPEFGLWHAYRAALAFEFTISGYDPPPRESPCKTCTSKPCLTACPVDAFRPDGFDVVRCRSFVGDPTGLECAAFGCAARRACPVGTEYIYDPAQAAFHMKAFLDDAPNPARAHTDRTLGQ